MSSVPVEVAVDTALHVGESPVWDASTGVLWFTDLMPGLVYRFDTMTGALTTLGLGQPVGAIVLRRDGGLVAAVRDGIALVNPATGALDVLAPIEADDLGNRMNDAKCDAAGRLWAGTMSFTFVEGAGSLYCVRPDGSWETAREGLTISNGLGWSPDGSTMYHVDTAAGILYAYDFDAAAGTIGGQRSLVTFDGTLGAPDGLAVDAEGGIWVAMFGGGCVRRFTGDGAEDGRVELPVGLVTSVAFGGDDLNDLYVTTARYELTPEQLAVQPSAGAVFRCRPGVSGLAVQSFAG